MARFNEDPGITIMAIQFLTQFKSRKDIMETFNGNFKAYFGLGALQVLVGLGAIGGGILSKLPNKELC